MRIVQKAHANIGKRRQPQFNQAVRGDRLFQIAATQRFDTMRRSARGVETDGERQRLRLGAETFNALIQDQAWLAVVGLF